MKKIRLPFILLAFAATSICGLGLAAKTASNEVVPTFATYTNHDADTYYSGISDDLTGNDLLSALQSLNSSKRKTTVGYSGMGTSPSGQFKYTDYDPNSVQYDSNGQPYGTKLITFYSGNSATSGMNREHVWPNSHGGNSVEDDIHMPRPTLNAENGSRGNSFYVEGKCHSSNGWDPAMEDFGLESYRGDSARIIFYCVVANSKLSLLEADSHSTSNSNRDNLMGRLSHLIKWHLENPVLEREQNRNEGAEYLQGNRNPFIDHRSYACKIWGNANSDTKKYCDQYNGWTDGDEPTPTKTLTKIAVSGTPTKKSYVAGEHFDTAGLTVTATFDDNSTENVTSKVTVSPDPLTKGTTSVTLSYTFGSVTQTATVSGITVTEATVNYGTLENPISVSAAKKIIENECTTSGSYTKQQIYCKGVAGSFLTSEDSTFRHKMYVKDLESTSSVVTVNSLNMTKDQYDVLETGDTIIFHGYGYIENSTDYFKFKGSDEVTLDRNVTKGDVIHVSSIDASIPSNDHHISDTFQISYTVSPSNATNKSVTFNSSDTSVATVSSSGLVTCKKIGNTTLTVTSVDNSSVKKTISLSVVKEPDIEVESIQVDQIYGTHYVGDEVQLDWTVYPSNATNKNVEFIVEDEDVATVSSTGLVSCVGVGSTMIQVHALDGSDVIEQVELVVSETPIDPIPVESIEIKNAPSTMYLNDELQLEVEILPSNATDKTLVWSSSDSRTITVSDTGLINAIDYDDSTITVSTVDGKVSDSCTISVVRKAPVNDIVEVVVAKYPDKTIYNVGEEFDSTGLVVEAHYLDGTVADVTSECEFSAPASMSIAGTKTINITFGTFTNISFKIEVIKDEVSELKIAKFPLKLNYFASEEFNPLGLQVEAKIGSKVKDVTQMVTFDFDFKKNNIVKVIFGELVAQFQVTIETGTITVEHKAADYTYIFKNELENVEKENVTLSMWNVLEYNYNSLSNDAKNALKNIVTNYGNGAVSAEDGLSEKLKECISNYDEIYLLHKDEGFTDFIGRNPKAPDPTPEPTPTPESETKPLFIVGIIVGIVFLVVIIIIIAVKVSKRRRNA